MENTVKDLKAFFSTPEKPVSTSEMMEFWKSCTDEQKQEFKTAELV